MVMSWAQFHSRDQIVHVLVCIMNNYRICWLVGTPSLHSRVSPNGNVKELFRSIVSHGNNYRLLVRAPPHSEQWQTLYGFYFITNRIRNFIIVKIWFRILKKKIKKNLFQVISTANLKYGIKKSPKAQNVDHLRVSYF